MKKRTFTSDAEFDQALADACAKLPKEILPTNDLWPGVRNNLNGVPTASRTKTEPSRTKTFMFRLAAGLLLVIGSSLSTVWWLQDDGPDAFIAEFGPTAANFGAIQDLDPEYLAVRTQLVADLESRMPDLTPETREIVEQNLKNIEVSLAEINVAVQSDPNNPGLQRLLLATYQQELNMLSHMNQVVSRPESVQL